MFRAQAMSRITLLLLASEAQDAAFLLARHGVFAPATDAREAWPQRVGVPYREVYLEAAARLGKIMEVCGDIEPLPMPDAAVAPTLRELQGVNARLREIWQTCSDCYETQRDLDEARLRIAKLEETFERLKHLDVDLARLLRPSPLLDARIGQLPLANVRRLRDALGLANAMLSVFDQAGDQAFAVVAAPRAEAGLDGLLVQAGWRALPIPAELQVRPEAARRFLADEQRRLEAASAQHCDLKQAQLAQHQDWLRQARLLLSLARPLAESALSGYRGRGQLAAFSGWVPQRALTSLRQSMQARFQGRFLLQARSPSAEEKGRVPSLLTYPAWLQPFVPLVRSYGVPRYGEFDPALLFAATYLFLFGAMFGDVGHGAVILVMASALSGRLNWLRVVGMLAGLASILFGFVYGSVFGSEALIPPLWQSPLHDPMRLLILAVSGGIGFIALTLLIAIYNRLAAGRIAHALFDGGGLAGLVFYLATVLGLANLLTQGMFGAPHALLALSALGVIAAYTWQASPAGFGERLLVTLIETLETATSLFANTLSFLRVAAFSLNHVALALAVFTLANGLGTAGHGLTLLLGNGVIIVLEGAIVAIQALRLMYYEGFSRFFSGDGVEFAPLRLEVP